MWIKVLKNGKLVTAAFLQTLEEGVFLKVACWCFLSLYFEETVLMSS